MEPRNPYIENYIKKLVEQKEGKLEPDALERLIESLHLLFQNMLGRNMVAALPEEVRAQFVLQYDKGCRDVEGAKISPIFEPYIPHPEEIMKKTLKEFTALYLQNR